MTPTKQPPQQPRRFTPLARDFDDYMQRSVADEMAAMQVSPGQRKPTPTRGSVLPQLNLDIPPYRAKPASSTSSMENHYGGSDTSSQGSSGIDKAPVSAGSNGRMPVSAFSNSRTRPVDGDVTSGNDGSSSAAPAISGYGFANAAQMYGQPLAVPSLAPSLMSVPLQRALPTADQQSATQPGSALASQKPLPEFNPAVSHMANASRPSSSSTNASFPPDELIFANWGPRSSNPDSPSPNTPSSVPASPPDSAHAPQSRDDSATPAPEVTAIHSVVVPALEAAIARRSHQLSQRNREESAHALRDPSGFMERRKLRNDAHEQVRKIVRNLVDGFRELDKWDSGAPVGMGGGVDNFLEGFLEEVLVRVEPSDE